MQPKRKALYVCPVTQGAMVVASALLAEEVDYDISKVLLLQGVVNREMPTPFERSEAIRPAKGIEAFFDGRGIAVDIKQGPPYDDGAWQKIVASSLTSGVLEGIDFILFNAQAGTKQMSFGAWDGLLQSAAPRGKTNLPVKRCFVQPGASVCLQFCGREWPLQELSIDDYLQLYGFKEAELLRRYAREQWVHDNKKTLGGLWDTIEADPSGRDAALHAFYKPYDGKDNLWNLNDFVTGGWLEVFLYLKAAELVDAKRLRPFAIIEDWASGEPNPNRYELDLVAINGAALHLFECKRSGVSQDDINKQGVLRDRLQGRAGRNVIFAGDPPRSDHPLQGKAAQKQIELAKADASTVSSLLQSIWTSAR